MYLPESFGFETTAANSHSMSFLKEENAFSWIPKKSLFYVNFKIYAEGGSHNRAEEEITTRKQYGALQMNDFNYIMT